MANFEKAVVCLATGTARPDWALAALASLLAAGIAGSLNMRSDNSLPASQVRDGHGTQNYTV